MYGRNGCKRNCFNYSPKMPMKKEPEKLYPVPSNGSLICTFADCCFRKDEIEDVVGEITGIPSTEPIDSDWSECGFNPDYIESCEVLLRTKNCPCGFSM